MPNRSTIDQISAVRLIVEKFREFRNGRSLYIAFIDLKAAFDSIDRRSLWSALEAIGLPSKLLNLFSALYDKSESCVKIGNKYSDWFPITSGVRQGCVAAPDLFNVIIDHLMTEVSPRIQGVYIGNYKLTDLEYADDTTLFASSGQELHESLKAFSTEAAKLGLEVNWTKTKLMHVGEGAIPHPINIMGQDIEFVDSFVYLGSTISANGEIRTEVNRRRGLAAGVLRSLWRPVWRHRNISRRVKLRIFNATVLPVLLYGAETWPLPKSMAGRISGFETRALRTIEGIRLDRHITNDELRRITGQTPILRILAQRRLRWFGHICRMPREIPTKAALDLDPSAIGWRRPRGAPRSRWLDIVSKDLQGLGLTVEQAKAAALDRRRWRSLVSLVVSTPSWQET